MRQIDLLRRRTAHKGGLTTFIINNLYALESFSILCAGMQKGMSENG
jgi:hypothetical protein